MLISRLLAASTDRAIPSLRPYLKSPSSLHFATQRAQSSNPRNKQAKHARAAGVKLRLRCAGTGQQQPQPQPEQMGMAIVGAEYCDPEERVLTVRKTSHFSPGDGFAAYDHRTGGLAFRADTYGRGHGGGAASAGELALLGPSGEPLLTMRRRRPSLHHRWEGFLGARADGQKALFSARRPSILGGAAAGAVIELLPPSLASSSPASTELLRVDGSFPRRCCRVVAAPRAEGEKAKVVAEIRRKVDEGARVVMGRDVFVLRVSPGFDAAFAMGIVLVLDQIAGDEASVDAGADVIDAKIW